MKRSGTEPRGISLASATRRDFLRASAGFGAAAAWPFMWTGRVAAAVPANERITVAAIGTGRMGRGDLGNMLSEAGAQVVAVCDVDANRCSDARRMVEKRYTKRSANGEFTGCKEYHDYREIIARGDVDAVLVCTPDHWHALPAIEAARSGKDVFIQKPMTYTIEEGRVLSDTARQYGRVVQVGSQQRSDQRFRFGCELVRNGRIGTITKVEVGCGIDPRTGNEPVMPVPEGLDYGMWVGPAPWMPYTEKRVHPRKGYGRPGWLRTHNYCIGMMTGWGSHHMDIAHWAMDFMETGPVAIDGWAEYADDGAWTVHGDWDVTYAYANGLNIHFGGNRRYKQGVTFHGTEGKVHVRRGRLDAEPKSLLKSTIGPGETHLYRTRGSHMHNFVECIRTRGETAAPVENGHRSCTVCILGDIAARLGRKLHWDPAKEQFLDDETANRMVTRPMRAPWVL
ncbi:MAG: Gfo/Idh/MocA family oxidoreductase [Lentisphaerae bacterium]|jgi:myo-inositol 2-dehydrogenase / D-chiro-inositol 1-dehydrogenase|nr:Gfo/Idh/MocA family oxidoreductase [Lentisphaerota bacterium]MBT5608808.1 Gfo/Idh/MocA family oxidoreductase [Lentisphaerota bacterium]MBT7058319.1 Gfo/Idh/MocA family oxidoreductase [Lentisphaerota bacterium]MBT7840294.1 Gfo/Idh/MocA family oxidoreductase [Lentisphaerota bacterium]